MATWKPERGQLFVMNVAPEEEPEEEIDGEAQEDQDQGEPRDEA
jgi:hypothetical protein